MSCERALSPEFAANLEALLKDEAQHSTSTLVLCANEAITWLKNTNDERRYLNKLDYANLLDAMLLCSDLCGSKRYSACAIAISYTTSENDDVNMENLSSLGLVWLSHLLYPFKGNGQGVAHIAELSETATPSKDKTAQELGDGLSQKRPETDAFADLVLERDGYKCVATGYWSRNHDDEHLPAGISREAVRYTQGAHILRRAVAVSKTEGQNRKESLASIATWDILRHYGALSGEMIRNVDKWVDSAENGITLAIDAHMDFDRFKWCFVPIEGETDTRKWKIKSFLRVDLMKDQVTFSDASVTAPTRSAKAVHGIPLPNPTFIRLHSAICHVLRMSGAAEVLDYYIDRFEKPTPGIRTGHDFLSWVAAESMLAIPGQA